MQPACSAGVYCPDCETWLSGHEELPLANHTFGAWVVTQQPTTDSTGIETRTCVECGETENQIVDKLPQPPEPPSDDNDNNNNQNIFQRILQWFRDLFERIASWFRF